MPTVNYLWNPINDSIVREFGDDGNVLAEYTTEPDGRLISESRDGVEYQHHYDAQGNTRALTNDQGEVTDTFAYNASGEVTERTGTTPTPFQFGGEHGYYTDQTTGEIMARRRDYDPAQGRWLSVDPLIRNITSNVMRLIAAYSGTIPDDNPYTYVANRPLVFVDPSGLAKCAVASWPKTVVPKCDIISLTSGLHFGATFGAKITFSSAKPNSCDCCSFRQFASGQMGVLQPGGMRIIDQRGGVNEQGREWFQEDCGTENGKRVCYGYRGEDFDTSKYSADGCTYTMKDRPGHQNIADYVAYMSRNGMTKGRMTINLRFLQKVVDTCNCPPKTDAYNLPVVETRELNINCELIIDLTKVGNETEIIDHGYPEKPKKAE